MKADCQLEQTTALEHKYWRSEQLISSALAMGLAYILKQGCQM